jgi:CcmD family protein
MIAYAISMKYMLAGYAVIFILLTIYLVSLLIRWRRLRQELDTLKNLEPEVG